MCGRRGIVFFIVLLISSVSCGSPQIQSHTEIYYAPIWEYLSLSRSAVGNPECTDKLYYLQVMKTRKAGEASSYSCQEVTPVDLTSGQISLEEIFGPNSTTSSQNIFAEWSEWSEGNIGNINCNGRIVGNDIDAIVWTCSGTYTECIWQSEKGLADVENGSFEKDIATGKTKLYFRAWTENAARVYLTADFIDGQVDLVKCGKTRLNMDIWKISADPACSSEGFYEFPSTSNPLVVKTHIVKPTEEIVREKTITEGVELNAGAN